MGAWIETGTTTQDRMQKVAPCVGAWIETLTEQLKEQRLQVAPCVGAWIETETKAGRAWRTKSRPAWARGLKLFNIEDLIKKTCRALRGRVD